ncbi:MAG: hypothetical protein K2K31_00230, partial [Clostridia bacterium]|nr:hypothetical protein [Clostridia bacterium]
VILGWGVGANEVFLSSLTYIWAFIPPLFMTLDKLIKNKKVLLGVVCALMLAVVVKNSITFVQILQYAHQVLPTF